MVHAQAAHMVNIYQLSTRDTATAVSSRTGLVQTTKYEYSFDISIR